MLGLGNGLKVVTSISLALALKFWGWTFLIFTRRTTLDLTGLTMILE